MLTDSQKLTILEAYEKDPKISLNDLVNLAFPRIPSWMVVQKRVV